DDRRRRRARPPAGHLGRAHPQDPVLGPAPRLRRRALDPRGLGGRAARRGGRALPGAAPARAARLDRERVGALGEQPPRQVLPAHPRGARAARRQELELGTLRRRREPRAGRRRRVALV
ncbi:MAG: Transcriptional regulator, PadR family, partial [uncultured Gemmatimonadaceae bacterium]